MKTTGTEYSQAPTNGDLGTLAFQNADDVNIIGGSMYTNTKTVANHYNDTNTSMVKPTLNLDFAKSKSLDPRVTYSRASTATYYDGSTTALAEQNLLTYSQDFSQSIWLKNAGSVTNISNTIPSPNGTLNASTLSADGSLNIHSFVQVLAVSTGKAMVFSCHIKAGTNYFVQLATNSGQGNMYANFDLSAGTTGSTNAVSSTILSMGNGWYRCSMSFNSISTVVSEYHICLTNFSSDANRQPNTLTTSLYLWGAQLEQRSAVSSYTPTTSTAITNYIPQLMTAANHRPRFDHDPVTRESRGLLLENAGTNLLTYSEQFDNVSWTKLNTTIIPNCIISPDGTLTGDKLVQSIGNSQHVVYQSPTNTGTLSFSYFAKAGERTWSVAGSGSNAKFIYVNLLTGAFTVDSGVIGSTVAIGNGWYKITVMYTIATTSSWGIYAASTANYTDIGDGYSGIYIWGAQLEAGGFATSYIPTVASQVTRASDSGVMSGVNFSSWYNYTEGTMLIDCDNIYYRAGYVSAGTGIGMGTYRNNAIFINAKRDGTTNPNGALLVYQTSSMYVLINVIDPTEYVTDPNRTWRWIAGFKSGDFSLYREGGANRGYITSSQQFAMPSPTQLSLNVDLYSYSPFSGHIKRFIYFPKKLTNLEMIELSTI